MMPEHSDLTDLLRQHREGNSQATNELIGRLYDELRSLAHRMRGKKDQQNETLNTTALVHEVHLKLIDKPLPAQDRAHFMAMAAKTMWRLLVDQARRRKKRKQVLDQYSVIINNKAYTDDDILDLDAALCRLAAEYPRKARVAELRFLSDLTVKEVADVLGVSEKTVERDWKFAKAWLRRALRDDDASPSIS